MCWRCCVIRTTNDYENEEKLRMRQEKIQTGTIGTAVKFNWLLKSETVNSSID